MKIVFLLGSPDISGGTYVIFEHATRLSRNGHQVTIATETPVAACRYEWHPSAGNLTWSALTELGREVFDVAIATWWQSVFQLERIVSHKYLYFIQSIESRFFEPKREDEPHLRDADIISGWCENTYRINLPVITEARWIQDYLLHHHNRPSVLVRNGIRKDIYCEDGPAVAERKPGTLRVLVEGPLGVFFKNVEKSLELCRKAEVDEIWLLTSSPQSEVTGADRCFSRVPVIKTAEIYRSCDVLVKLSYVEGMFGPPLEIFHCGGTAIVYDVTGHDEYIRHGENSLVVERDNENQVVAWLRRLKSDPELLDKLKQGARETAAAWPDWDVAASRFGEALQASVENSQDVSRTFLAESTSWLLSIRNQGLQARELARMAERERHGGEVISFLNHVQVYWDCGRGMEPVLMSRYHSGSWCRCRIIVPADLPPKVIRVDPSVRIGIVEIRTLMVTGENSGNVLAHWEAGQSWESITVAGTACVLRWSPYPILEAYGEDPQLFLPPLTGLCDGEPLHLDIEVREWSFAQGLLSLGGIGRGSFSEAWRDVAVLPERVIGKIVKIPGKLKRLFSGK